MARTLFRTDIEMPGSVLTHWQQKQCTGAAQSFCKQSIHHISKMQIAELDFKAECRTPLYNVQRKPQLASQAIHMPAATAILPSREEGQTQTQPHAAMVKLLSCCTECILIVHPINIHVWTVLACVGPECASLHIAEIQGPEVTEHQVFGFQFNPEHLSSLHSTWKELGALEWDVKYYLLITRNCKAQGRAQTPTLLYRLDAWVDNMKEVKTSTQELKPGYDCLCVTVFRKKREVC